MTMTLHYLHFDYSEDAGGLGSFEAMAATAAAQAPRVQAEAAQVLAWAYQQFEGACGALDEGGEWDYDLQGKVETSNAQSLRYDPQHRQLSVQAESAAATWHTLTLVLSGNPAFCEAFRDRFMADEG